MGRTWAAWLLVVGMLAGCDQEAPAPSASVPGGPCATNADCPGNLLCVGSRCVRPTESAPRAQGTMGSAGATAVPTVVAPTERERLLADPGAFLTTMDLHVYDKGIVNHYRQLTSLTVENRSSLRVGSIEGVVTYADASGHPIGTVPFTLTGTLAPKETRVFTTAQSTLASGTLQGVSATTRIAYTRVMVD